MTITDIMKNLEKEGGTFSEGDLNKLSEITGKSRNELFEIYNSESEPAIPKVENPSNMRTKEKVAYIKEHGREAFEKLFET